MTHLDCYDYEGNPISFEEWSSLFESDDRLLAQETIGPYFLSTVWLGLDHSFGHADEPWIYESMIFRDGESIDQFRCARKEDALAWHERWREQLQAWVAADLDSAVRTEDEG